MDKKELAELAQYLPSTAHSSHPLEERPYNAQLLAPEYVKEFLNFLRHPIGGATFTVISSRHNDAGTIRFRTLSTGALLIIQESPRER